MSKPILNTFIVKQASSFGVRFLWKNTYIIKPNVIETIRPDDLYYYSVHEEDQSLFDSFAQLFYNTYREVKIHNMSIYVRKETKVGDFVQFGNDTLYLIEENKLVPATSSYMNGNEIKSMSDFFSNTLEAEKKITKAF